MGRISKDKIFLTSTSLIVVLKTRFAYELTKTDGKIYFFR